MSEPLHETIRRAADRLSGQRADLGRIDPGILAPLFVDDGVPEPLSPDFVDRVRRLMREHPPETQEARETQLWYSRVAGPRAVKLLIALGRAETAQAPVLAEALAVHLHHLQTFVPIAANSSRNLVGAATAGAALAIGGALLQTDLDDAAARMGELWLLTGAARMLHDLGRVEDAGQRAALEHLFGLARQVCESRGIAWPASDEDARIGVTAETFWQHVDLSYPGLERVAEHVAQQDWDGARDAYLDSLGERFRPEAGWPLRLLGDASDQAEADEICENIFVLQAHMYRRYDFGEEVEWPRVIDDDIESRVWMNAHPFLVTLAEVYLATRDRKYLRHLCRLVNSWYEQSPAPLKRDSAQWRTLEAGNRMGQKWPPVIVSLAQEPIFRREALFRMATSVLDHARYLSMHAAGGGNWLQVESSGLGCAALLFPELKLSAVLLDIAVKRLEWINARAFLPDGFQSECSAMYHYFPVLGISAFMQLVGHRDGSEDPSARTAREASPGTDEDAERPQARMPAPRGFREQFRRALEVMYEVAQPDTVLPMISDCSPREHSIVPLMEVGERVFGGPHFRWFATGGEKGRPPRQPSVDFPHAGYCVMRDRWGPDGQYLLFDAGYYGAGHQHEDKLNFVYASHGRVLIGDPGIYAYKRDEYKPYWKGSWGHNTIVVDGKGQHRGLLGKREPRPDPDRTFVIGKRFDYAAGWYRDGYSPCESLRHGGRKVDDDRAAAEMGVQHRRCILFLKGEYAVVFDLVTGEREHLVERIFHFAPIVESPHEDGVRPVSLALMDDGGAASAEQHTSNVAVIPALMEGLEVRDECGQTNPVRGWFALYGIQPSHDITYSVKAPLPIALAAVIWPWGPGAGELPSVERVDVRSGGAPAFAMSLNHDGGTDLVCLSFDGPALIETEHVTADAELAFVRIARDGSLGPVCGVNARSIEVGAETVVREEVRRESVEVAPGARRG